MFGVIVCMYMYVWCVYEHVRVVFVVCVRVCVLYVCVWCVCTCVCVWCVCLCVCDVYVFGVCVCGK